MAGQAEAAAQHLEAALRQRPEDAEIHEALATAYGSSGRIEAALDHYKRAARLDVTREGAWVGGAQLLVRQRRYGDAIGVLETGLLQLPHGGRIAHALARLLAGSPDPALRRGQRALTLAQAVFAAAPTVDHAQTVAMAFAETGDCAAAENWQQQALEQAVAQSNGSPQGVAALRDTLAHYRDARPCAFPADPPPTEAAAARQP